MIGKPVSIVEGDELMARQAKKSLDDKIIQKQELINSLNIRIKKEKEELQDMMEAKKTEELNELRRVIEGSGMGITELIQLAQTGQA